jgi:hypothetical protein
MYSSDLSMREYVGVGRLGMMLSTDRPQGRFAFLRFASLSLTAIRRRGRLVVRQAKRGGQ